MLHWFLKDEYLCMHFRKSGASANIISTLRSQAVPRSARRGLQGVDSGVHILHRLTASRPALGGALSRWDIVDTGTLGEITAKSIF